MTVWRGSVQGLEIGTGNLQDLQWSVKSRSGEGMLMRASSNDSAMCGICMEHPEVVELTRCNHSLCANCARQLLAVAASSACACPFCRKYIGGFAASKHATTQP